MPKAYCPLLIAQCPMPNAQCQMPDAQCLMPTPNVQCPHRHSEAERLGGTVPNPDPNPDPKPNPNPNAVRQSDQEALWLELFTGPAEQHDMPKVPPSRATTCCPGRLGRTAWGLGCS